MINSFWMAQRLEIKPLPERRWLLAAAQAAHRRPGGGASRGNAAAVRRHGESVNGAQAGIHHAAGQARILLFDGAGKGDDGGQLGVIAVVEELIELFARPGGGALGAQVVEDEHGGGADFVEAPVVRGGAVGVKGCA